MKKRTTPDSVKYVDQLVLTYQKRNEGKLAFMNLYEPEKDSFKNKLQTMKSWALRFSYEKSISDIDHDVIDNEPQKGFKLVRHVERGGESTRTLWRVEDPRGFQMEIPSANLEYLFERMDLIDQTLQKPLLWIQTSPVNGGSMWLVEENSDLHKQGLDFAQLRTKRIPLRDVSRGDIVRLHDGRTVKYLGGMYYYDSARNLKSPNQKDPKRAYFFVVEDGKCHTRGYVEKPGHLDKKSSINVGQIVEEADEPLTKKEAEKIANDRIKNDQYGGRYAAPPPFVRASKFTREEVTVERDFRGDKYFIGGDEYGERRK